MKTFSDERPRSLMPLGDGNWHYNWNITETEAPASPMAGDESEQLRTQYVFDTVFIAGEPTVSKIVSAVVHDQYTDDDIALMNAQHQAAAMGLDDEPEGYETYLSLVVTTRAEAKEAVENMDSEPSQASEQDEGEEAESETEEETIDPDEVGSVEDVLGGETDNEE